ncbi:MAG: hypothetical protein IPP17_05710, partial [Bacteroidetes bacterium]|nr:hypothetical protein [Bacteroidota bacterium]
MEKLQRGDSFELEEYISSTIRRVPNMSGSLLAPIVVIEGLLVFNNPIVNETLDLKVFVDTFRSICVFDGDLARRWGNGGYGLDDVLAY